MVQSLPRPGTLVALVSGTFKGSEGMFEKWCPDSQKALLLINVFGCEVPVEAAIDEFTTDVEAARSAAAKEWTRAYVQWASEKRASLGLPLGDSQHVELKKLAGSYDTDAGIHTQRLTLSASGMLQLSRWQDIGCSWGTYFTGFYLADADVIHSNVQDVEPCLSSFYREGRLFVRHASSGRVLVPEDSVREFDRLCAADEASGVDALETTLFYQRSE